jgi:hypothetical protein
MASSVRPKRRYCMPPLSHFPGSPATPACGAVWVRPGGWAHPYTATVRAADSLAPRNGGGQRKSPFLRIGATHIESRNVGSANLKTAYFNSPCQGKTIKNIATGASVHYYRASCRFPRATKWAEGQGEGFVPSMVAVSRRARAVAAPFCSCIWRAKHVRMLPVAGLSRRCLKRNPGLSAG